MQVESAACHCHSSGCQRLLQEVTAQCDVAAEAECDLWISLKQLRGTRVGSGQVEGFEFLGTCSINKSEDSGFTNKSAGLSSTKSATYGSKTWGRDQRNSDIIPKNMMCFRNFG